MFPQVSPSLLILDFASLTTIAFCAPFVFMVLRIAFPATPLDSHLYKLPGAVGAKPGKPSAKFVQWTLTSLHSSTYELFVAAKNSNSFVFNQIQTLWVKHPGWGALTTRECSGCRSFRGVRVGPQLGKLPPTRLGAIIPLCIPNIWRRAFVSLADRHCFSLGVTHGCTR